MNPKHDRTHSRTATDIESKYDLGGISEQGSKIREQNLMVSQLSQALSQFMATTNAEIANMKERLEESATIKNVYPVGSIYISVNNINPKEIFGFGVWEQIKDRFLLSAGDTYAGGDTGGEAKHTLTNSELPKLSGAMLLRKFNGAYGIITAVNGVFSNENFTQTAGSMVQGETSETLQRITFNVGNNEAHNNMPPYLTVYVWKRTA